MTVLPRLTGEQIVALRKSRNLSQTEFGVIFKVSRRSVAAWESDTWRAPADLLERFTDSAIVAAQEQVGGTAKDRATLEAYTEMRGHRSHESILTYWHAEGFTPSREAQQMILEAFPELKSSPKPSET